MRRGFAPWLRRAEVAWPGFAVLLILLLWVLPIQDWKMALIIVVLAIVGFEVFRRQVERELPVAAPSPLVAGAKARVEGMRGSLSRPAPSRTDELERLAGLHASGALTDEEFASAKAELFAATS